MAKAIGEPRADAQNSGSTMAQLRNDIDRGLTGEKVDWPDPAAAPLGTDDEAAGQPADPLTIHETRRRERHKVMSKQGKDASWLILPVAAVVIVLLGALASSLVALASISG
jgi:hypothetical protein